MTCVMNSLEVANMVEGKPSSTIGSAVLSPSLQSMINSFNADGKDDRALFLALLSAKTAEDKRLMALDNFRAEQLRAANTLYAHASFQAQQTQNQQNIFSQQQQQQLTGAVGNFWSNPVRPSNSSHSNLNPRSPLSPPSTVTSTSISTSHQYSRETSQTPSNLSDIPTRSAKSLNSSSKRKAGGESFKSRRPSSSGSSSAGMEREVGQVENRKKYKSSNVKPSHEEAMQALRARCERNTRDRQQSGSSTTSSTNTTALAATTDEGGALLHKSISLPQSITSSSDAPTNFSPQISPSLSISTAASSVFFSPSIVSPSTSATLTPTSNLSNSATKEKSQLSREEARFLAMSTLRPVVAITLPTAIVMESAAVVGSPEAMVVEPVDMNEPSTSVGGGKSTEGTSASLRRLLNSSSERSTVTRVSDVRGE